LFYDCPAVKVLAEISRLRHSPRYGLSTRRQAICCGRRALDRDDFGSNRSKIMNVIDSNNLERDASEKVLTLFLIPL
jgi:hypothetical protein